MKIRILYKTGGRVELEIPAPSLNIDLDDMNPVLEWLFRQLNRVNGAELISLFKLPYPSLSVGDRVEFEQGVSSARYLCDTVGWELEEQP